VLVTKRPRGQFPTAAAFTCNISRHPQSNGIRIHCTAQAKLCQIHWDDLSDIAPIFVALLGFVVVVVAVFDFITVDLRGVA
jgi:hypothetical protein